MLTLAEQERRAYMRGNTELAAALSLAQDAEDGADDMVLRSEYNTLQDTLDRVEDELHEVEGRLDDVRRDLRAAENERDELQARIDEMIDVA